MKHVEIAKAWLDGKCVQVKSSDGWVDLAPHQERDKMPDFHDFFPYRIKPEVVKYRRYLHYTGKDGGKTISCASEITAGSAEGWIRFIRWIDTEWQEVEV